LNGDGLVGVDIDHCVTDGTPSGQAAALLDKLGAGYIEISPSGTGLRAIGYGEQLTAGVNGSLDGLKAEFYSTSRYLTLTGKTIKAGPIVPLVGFKAVAESFRAIKKAKVNASTGELEQTRPDERHAAMVRGILSGNVYHDNLRDLAASLVATGMQAGAVVNHLSGLMDASTGPHDDRWTSRRQQIPDLVSSAVAKFVPQPLDFSILQRLSGEVQQDGEHDVSIANLGTFAPVPPQFWIDEILPTWSRCWVPTVGLAKQRWPSLPPFVAPWGCPSWANPQNPLTCFCTVRKMTLTCCGGACSRSASV
jgi:hypothetical protein